MTVALSSFCYCASCARPCYTLYEILLRHRSTLYFCGCDRLLSMDPPCSFVAMAPLDLIWRLFVYWATIIVSSVIHMLDPPIFMAMFCIWTCMCQRSVFLTFISLSGTFTRAFFILDSLLSPYSAVSFIMYFGYHLQFYPHTLGGICYSSKWHISSCDHFPMISSHVDTSKTTLHESH